MTRVHLTAPLLRDICLEKEAIDANFIATLR